MIGRPKHPHSQCTRSGKHEYGRRWCHQRWFHFHSDPDRDIPILTFFCFVFSSPRGLHGRPRDLDRGVVAKHSQAKCTVLTGPLSTTRSEHDDNTNNNNKSSNDNNTKHWPRARTYNVVSLLSAENAPSGNLVRSLCVADLSESSSRDPRRDRCKGKGRKGSKRRLTP